jgi:hypothetical protein
MIREPRKSLYDRFRDGSLPTSEDFAALIDSSVNIIDQGFDKTDDSGLQVRTAANGDALLSFYRDQNSTESLWTTTLEGKDNQFVFRGGSQREPLVTLHRNPQRADDQRVGIGTRGEPRCLLDVAGTVGMQGRLGEPVVATPAEPLVADGRWKTVLGGLAGCQMLEIVAGVAAAPNKGRYALLHAVVMNTYNPSWWTTPWFGRRSIRAQHAFYTRRADRLQLCWSGGHGEGQTYELKIRSGCDYMAEARRQRKREGKPLLPEEDARIQVYVTRLWHDPLMERSRPK